MIAVETKNLFVYYGDNEIVRNANIKVEQGEVLSIVGANGSGKSTLIKAIARLNKKIKGEVYFFGENINKIDTKALARDLAILPQMKNLESDITVEKLVSYGRYPHLKFQERISGEHREIINRAIKKVRLEKLKERPVRTLSGGERQRAWIAMALAQNPKVLIMDEPTTFLDIAHQIDVLETVKELNESLGLTVIMVLHEINHAIRYSDKICALKEGDIVVSNATKTVIDEGFIDEIFSIKGDFYDDEKHNCKFLIPDELKAI